MPTNRRLSLEQIQSWLDLVNPHFENIDPEKQAELAAKREQKRQETLQHYFDHVLPAVVEGLNKDPRHAALREERIHTLVSLMGFSPETTVISAAVVRPERLIVIYGAPDDEDEARKVEFSFDIAQMFLMQHRILRGAQIDKFVIDPVKPAQIYKVICEAIDQTPTINDNSSALVDITGGKKVMSATGGQAAWEVRLPLLYVDGEYDPNLRRPWPGTEHVVKLNNPSQLEQLQMRIDALSLYSIRNYPQAVQAFEECVANRTDERLDVLAAALCRVYVRWTDLDLPRLEQEVETVTNRLNEPRVIRLFKDMHQSRDPMFARLDTLRKVARAEPLAMIATFLELAELYQSQAFQRSDFACLLVYRAMEATVEFGLKSVAESEFDLGNPEWSLLGDETELTKGYVALSRKLDKDKGKKRTETSLPRDITLVNGIALLCLCPDVKLHEIADMQHTSLVGKMAGIANKRNASVLAHGTRTLSAVDFDEMSKVAESLAKWILNETDASQLKQLRENLKPIDVKPLHDPSQY